MADAKMTGALLGAMLGMLSGACPAAGAGGGEEPLADIFLCGDVMTGRGIDQILAHPADPVLYERHVKDARRYIRIAEQESGRIPRPAPFAYVWGDALEELRRREPDVRLINLETSVTEHDERWPGKGIHYRMHPDNLPALAAAGVDVCSLANNHVLDWGYGGLAETLASLRGADIATTGAGPNLDRARRPAVVPLAAGGRVLVFGYATASSGVPAAWAAAAERPGVNRLAKLSRGAVAAIAEQVRSAKRPGDVVIASIHWGGNWGHAIPAEQREFAHRLIDEAQVDVVHGHSSHHVKAIEVYQNKPVLYGCGDFLNDYEGIGGHQSYRPHLSLMYFLRLEPTTGELRSLRMVPMRIHRFRLERASADDTRWLEQLLDRQGRPFGTGAETTDQGELVLRWK